MELILTLEVRMSKKLFIFDLDGVLVDACEWHKDALNEALKEVVDYSITTEEHLSTFNGIPTREKLKLLSERGIVPIELHNKINNLKQEKTIEIIEQKAFKRKEKVEMLKIIKESNHIICCYTNSISKTAHLMLEKTGIKEFFQIILTNEDVKKPKPDAEGYKYLINLFDIEKESCYIIEDSPKGKKAAYASGANVVEVDGVNDVDFELLRSFI